MNSIELLYDFFEDHAKAAWNANEFRPVVFGIIVFALGGLSSFMAQSLTGRLFAFNFSFSSLGVAILLEITLGFIFTAVVHLIMEFGSVKGNAAALFVLMGLSSTVWALALPLLLITRLLAPASVFINAFVFLAVWVMVLLFKARSVRDNYHVGFFRGLVTVIIPYLGVFMAFMIAFSYAVWRAISQIMNFVSV